MSAVWKEASAADKPRPRPLSRSPPKRMAMASAGFVFAASRTCLAQACCPSFSPPRCRALLTAAGYKHEVTVVSASPDPAHVTMPRVHTIAALLKRWLLGTHQGGVQHVHLDYYLDEFAFRFNRRRSKTRGCSSTGSLTRPSPSD